MSRFAVVDLSNLMARCRHVVIGDLDTKVGMATQIIFRSLRKLHREQQVDHMVFAADSGSWRYAAYPAYKARRKLDRLVQKAGEEEEAAAFDQAQRRLLRFLATRTRCTVLERQDIEGDDFVARWVQRHPDDEHVIVSGDSDFVQMLARNVRIFDGVQERMLGIEGVTDNKGRTMEFTVQPGDGKIKVGAATPGFVAEAEWWRKALFIKLIRGDSGDGIFAANPGVRYKGTAKRTGIAEAWEDRLDQGIAWTNFFQQQWDKLDGVDEHGERIVRKVRVCDEYEVNVGLIDLSAQPVAVKQAMDAAIADAIHKPEVSGVGLHFMRFCGQHDLPALANEAADHAAYLNAGYPGVSQFELHGVSAAPPP